MAGFGRPISRRRFVGSAAAGMTMLPAALRRAMAAPARRRGGLDQIEHVVIFMQENRSFDSYFGTLRGVRGFRDPAAVTLPNGSSVFRQPTLGSWVSPYHLDTATTSGECAAFQSQSWGASHAAWNHGKMDRWLDGTIPGISVPGVMGYFARQDLPFYYALADAFTICDGYHCSVLGPTTPNRLYLWSGMVDAEGRYGGPIRSNDRPIALRWTTYAERLQKAGVSWRVYQQEDNFDDNALAWFDVFQRAQPGSPLYENGMRRRPEQAFADDVRNDRLPNVSWLVAPGWESEHPDHRPSDGAALCSRYLAALASNPAVWEKTLFILNYDEHGGAFDHVPPPSPPKGTPGEFIGTESIGLGFRVPCIVVSPWSQGGWVCGNVFDHTSVLRLLETVFAVREPNISQWRRATCGNLIDAVDLSHPVTSFPKLPSTGPEQERANCAGKSLKYPVYGGEPMPPQEAGTRPRRTGTSSGTGGGVGDGGGSGSGGSADGGGSGGSGTTRTTGAPATDGGTTSTLLPEGTTSVPGPGGSLPTGSTSTTRRPRRARSASGDNDTAAPTAIAAVAALASAAATARMAWRRSGRAGAGGPSGASGAGAAGLGPVERARPLRAPDPSGPNPAGPADPAGADPGATDRPGAGGA